MAIAIDRPVINRASFTVISSYGRRHRPDVGDSQESAKSVARGLLPPLKSGGLPTSQIFYV